MPADEIQDRLREFFRDVPGLAAVYLFGSVARGTQTAKSDVDVGLLYRQTPPQTLDARPFDLEADLSEILERPAQLIVMNDAPADLVHRILRDGILITEQDPSRRIAFEVQARNKYWDLKPILDEYRQAAR